MSFEAPSGESPRAEPDRPRASGDPLAALLTRLRAWTGWVGTGRIVAGAVFVVAVVAAGWWVLRTPPPPTEAGLPFAATSTVPAGADSRPPGSVAPSTSAPPAVIIVHVAGAVNEPGVYELPTGSRVGAAIETAGGPSRRADPGALNLAAPLADGERVYVPKVGESVPLVAAEDAPPGSPAPAGPIDVNRATAEQLDTLPGIGPTTAAAIVDHREQNGPFASVDDLEAVRGIGPAKLDAIRDLVSV